MVSLIESVMIPEGSRGPWAVKKFEVSLSEARFSAARAAVKGRGYVAPGVYTKLVHAQRGIIMSDTPDEKRDHYPAVWKARDHVLMNGLGLGMVLAAILRKPEVSKVTVVEIDADVIALIGPHYPDKRVEIVHADAFAYKPPKDARYGAVWHDIWDTVCGDNLPEMTRLKRKYARKADWQGCWAQADCQRFR